MSKFHRIEKCRVCGNEHLITVLDLGDQYLSGIFPKEIDEDMYKGPLTLVKCDESKGGCGHVQLEHTFDLPTMYGEEYGYRSGLNGSMVRHLRGKAEKIMRDVKFTSGDIVIDIAGNDGTFLGFFPHDLQLMSIDPTSKKFRDYIPENVNYIADFFSSDVYRERFGKQKAKVVTSFSMFYDLEDPCEFARQVHDILDPRGIWVLEQSYMPTMLRVNSFDTVCHEHLSYYGMRQLKYIMDKSGFKIVDFEFNDVNGGSISVVVTPSTNSERKECTVKLTALIASELEDKLDTVEPWEAFAERINACKKQFWEIMDFYRRNGSKICALGASTKGNVTLQTWEIGPKDVAAVGDVNPDKDGSFTPGTWIPITSEESVLEKEYDLHIVLPWHFRDFFLKNEKFKGRRFLFPLPEPEVVIIP
jgi:NDP-4-keto-2,6-dideoxyhexose 3-C-methyltransferase